LKTASEAEWKRIIHCNKHLPVMEKRYFISDIILDGSDIDIMKIEVTYQEHLDWMRKHMRRVRNHNLEKGYQMLSLDAAAQEGSDSLPEGRKAATRELEALVLRDCLIDDLRIALRTWNPWAEDFLDLYLSEQSKSSAVIVAKKYGVSERMGRTYKKQFEEFLRNFLF
jgi:hypothetical protein